MENDPKLRELLQRWTPIEPVAGFEARVWRRMAARRTWPQRLAIGVRNLRGALIVRPLLAPGVAALLAMVIGAAVALPSGAAIQSRNAAAQASLLQPDTFTSRYLGLIRGGQP